MKKFHQKPNRFVEQITLNVIDLERSLVFYREILGFSVLSKSSQKADLTADGKTPLVTLVQPNDVIENERRTTGLYHFALLLPERRDLGNFLHHLIEKNIPFGASDHEVSEAIYLKCPDGNGIEVYRDRPASEWKWTGEEVTMKTDPLHTEEVLKASDSKWVQLPVGTIMGHIHLHVKDLEETEQFYKEILGFDVVTRYPGALFMSTGGYHHHFGLNIWNGEGAPAPRENSVGLNSFTLVLSDELVRKEIVDKLKNQGMTLEAKADKAVIKDPSGNTIYLVV